MAQTPTSKQIIVRMPADLHERVKSIADSYDWTVSQAVRAAIRKWAEEPTAVPVR
jgi:predicted DNA-binding protein